MALLLNADLRGSIGGEGFRNAILIYADFDNAVLGDADFSGATLGGARFCHARNLNRASFKGAIYDAQTRWPPGFSPATRGAKRVGGFRAREVKFGDLAGGQGVFQVPFPRCTG